MSSGAQIIFGDSSFPKPAHVRTVAEAKELVKQFLPAVADAEGHEDEQGNIVFTKRAGRKG